VLGALLASGALATTTAAAAVPAASLGPKLLTGLGKWLVLGGLAGTVAGSLYVAGHVGVKSPASSSAAPVITSLAPKAAPPPVDEAEPTASAEPPMRAAARASVAKHDVAAPGLEAELAGLHAAHAAYRSGNAGRALKLLAEHKANFPKSQLATERATLEVLSLCRVGRTDDARSLAERLRKNAASAAALAGLDGSCAAK
jgi:hypothetical protein